MFDVETSEQCSTLLALAIGEIMEDLTPLAVRRPRDGLTGFSDLSAQLQAAGSDIAVLAAAIEVFARRSEPAT